MLADLREQREQIEQAIIVLERIAAGQGPRRAYFSIMPYMGGCEASGTSQCSDHSKSR
jgi:hypothetical protein